MNLGYLWGKNGNLNVFGYKNAEKSVDNHALMLYNKNDTGHF